MNPFYATAGGCLKTYFGWMRAFEGDIWLSGGRGRCYLVKWGEGEGGEGLGEDGNVIWVSGEGISGGE